MEEGQNVRRIGAGPRGAILDWLVESGATLEGIWRELQAREAISGEIDFVHEILRRYGRDEVRFTLEALYEREAQLERLRENSSAGPLFKDGVPPETRKRQLRSFLLVMPDGLFLSAVAAGYVKVAQAWGEYDKPPPHPWDQFNRIFEKRNVPYRFDDEGEPCWHGDKAAHDHLLEPALDTLRDQRLEIPLKDFDHALEQLRIGTSKARENAANHAVKALEGTLKAVLEDRQLDLPRKMQAYLLWERLREAGVVEPHTQVWVTATTKVSNEKGRHSSSTEVSVAEAEAAVMSAAVAVSFFGTFMTENPT